MKAIPERQFEKILRDNNCTWTTTGSNEHIIRYQGKPVSTYAVWHAKRRKREVGMVYVKRFLKLIEGIRATEGV